MSPPEAEAGLLICGRSGLGVLLNTLPCTELCGLVAQEWRILGLFLSLSSWNSLPLAECSAFTLSSPTGGHLGYPVVCSDKECWGEHPRQSVCVCVCVCVCVLCAKEFLGGTLCSRTHSQVPPQTGWTRSHPQHCLGCRFSASLPAFRII